MMDVVTEINYNGEWIQFKGVMLFKRFFEIQEEFGKPTGINKETWWYEPSEFGRYFLEEVCIDAKDLPNEISEEDWKLFYPVFEAFFPTVQEYAVIIKNVEFLAGVTDGVREDKGLYQFLFMTEFGTLKFQDIDNLPLKEALILYYYIMNTRLLDNIKKMGFQKPIDNSEGMTQ